MKPITEVVGSGIAHIGYGWVRVDVWGTRKTEDWLATLELSAGY